MTKAFIMAAGMGKRLRPYTDTLPKPLVPVAGQPTIGHILDHLAAAGVRDVTVNLHYRADQLAAYLAQRTTSDLTIRTSYEETLLDTGGGIKAQLDHFGTDPFYVINGDAYWTDGAQGNCFHRLSAAWRDADMDLLLLLQDINRMVLTDGVGDYAAMPDGRIERQRDASGTYMFAGIRLCHPRLFAGTPDGTFGFLPLMDGAEANGRLYGLAHDGDWHHISTPEELERVEAAFAASTAHKVRA
ncbi:MAG: nucleotidyltransferase family protein [Pseudomonadota bacterium]